jgi:hypothetical protein
MVTLLPSSESILFACSAQIPATNATTVQANTSKSLMKDGEENFSTEKLRHRSISVRIITPSLKHGQAISD